MYNKLLFIIKCFIHTQKNLILSLFFFNSLKVKEKDEKIDVEIEFIILFYFDSLKVKEKYRKVEVE